MRFLKMFFSTQPSRPELGPLGPMTAADKAEFINLLQGRVPNPELLTPLHPSPPVAAFDAIKVHHGFEEPMPPEPPPRGFFAMLRRWFSMRS